LQRITLCFLRKDHNAYWPYIISMQTEFRKIVQNSKESQAFLYEKSSLLVTHFYAYGVTHLILKPQIMVAYQFY